MQYNISLYLKNIYYGDTAQIACMDAVAPAYDWLPNKFATHGVYAKAPFGRDPCRFQQGHGFVGPKQIFKLHDLCGSQGGRGVGKQG